MEYNIQIFTVQVVNAQGFYGTLAALLPLGLDSLLSSRWKMNSKVYQGVLQDNVRVVVSQQRLSRSWVMQRDSEPRHGSKSATESKQRKAAFWSGSARIPKPSVVE